MSIIEHIVLFSFLFIFYAIWGIYNANRNDKAFWEAAIIPIVLYVCIVGSRYGWGNDYLIYKFEFENAFSFPQEQVVFKWLNQFLNIIGFNYVGAYMAYALIFIVCAFVFLRSYGEQSIYMYCFLVPATLYISAHTIRQGVGTSFLLLALVFLQNKKWIYMIIAAVIAYYIHSATVITLGILLASFFLLKRPIHYIISIPLYLFFTLIYDVRNTAFLADFLKTHVTLSGNFQSYINNSSMWFGEDAINDIYTQSSFALITSSLFYISIFYLGYQALRIRYDKRVVYIFNVVALGFILYRAVIPFEILNRMTLTLQMFYFVPLGYAIYVYFQDCRQPESRDANQFKKTFPIGITLALMYLFMYWGRFIFLNQEADFFWYH